MRKIDMEPINMEPGWRIKKRPDIIPIKTPNDPDLFIRLFAYRPSITSENSREFLSTEDYLKEIGRFTNVISTKPIPIPVFGETDTIQA